MRHCSFLLAFLLLIGCLREPPKHAAPPAAAEPIAHEAELLRLTLTPQAQQRLGVATVPAIDGSAHAMRQAAGEIVVPPTRAGGVPTGSLANLQQLGAQQVAAEGEVARAAAQARLARIALERADSLVREGAGSLRARDEATAALATADAALAAARRQRHLLGPPIAAMNSQPLMWVRVSVLGSDLDAIRHDEPAMVQALGAHGSPRAAQPVQAPPSADVSAGTVDLFYALSNEDEAFRVGQRVAVDLPLAAQSTGLLVPSTAIVRDIYGGEWVYENTRPNTYVRRRIEVAFERDGRALLARGLHFGAEIVTAGAAELFGIEFGTAY